MNAAQTRDLAAVEDARPVSVEPASSEDVTAIFRKEGDFWTIAWQGKVSRVKDIKGLAYVAQLLRYPGKEFHAFDLVAATDTVFGERVAGGTGTAGGGHDEERIEDMGLRPGLPEDAGEMLDSTVKAAYRRRLSELREELEEAKKRGNVERASNAEDEIEFLNRELARAVGISGHDRAPHRPRKGRGLTRLAL